MRKRCIECPPPLFSPFTSSNNYCYDNQLQVNLQTNGENRVKRRQFLIVAISIHLNFPMGALALKLPRSYTGKTVTAAGRWSHALLYFMSA